MVPRHGADEEAAAPPRKLRPRINHEPTRRNARGPNPKRLLHSFLRGDALADGPAGILPSIRDHGPAVVGAAMNDIQFVSTQRTVLVLPQFPGFRVDHQPLRVAMSVTPDLRSRVFCSNERIVGWNCAVIAQAKDLAGVISKLLRAVLMMALAKCEEQIAVQEGHASAVMEAIFGIGVGREDPLAIDKLVFPQVVAVRAVGAALARSFGITEVDPAILRVIGMQRDIVKSRILPGQGRRAVGVVNAGIGADQRLGTTFHRSDYAGLEVQQIDALLPLNEERPAVRQED